MATVTAPWAAKCSCRGTAPAGRGGSWLFQTRVRSGRQPVRKEAREGLHIAAGA